jgi:hypothetical protein
MEVRASAGSMTRGIERDLAVGASNHSNQVGLRGLLPASEAGALGLAI